MGWMHPIDTFRYRQWHRNEKRTNQKLSLFLPPTDLLHFLGHAVILQVTFMADNSRRAVGNQKVSNIVTAIECLVERTVISLKIVYFSTKENFNTSYILFSNTNKERSYG